MIGFPFISQMPLTRDNHGQRQQMLLTHNPFAFSIDERAGFLFDGKNGQVGVLTFS